MITIYSVFAKGCKDCAKMKADLTGLLQGIDSGLFKWDIIDSEDDVAVDLAIEFGLEEIPFTVVDNHPFTIEDFDIDVIRGLIA